jgi:nucleolar complex protein 3
MLTQLAVFKDIIPGYRIRRLTEKELQEQKVSKEVRKLRNYEETLLSNYQAYLQSLEDLAQANMLRGNPYLLKIAIVCLTDLLGSVTHFNFRINLITACINKIVMKKNPEVTQMCCDAIAKLFAEDEHGESSFEAVRIMSDMFKVARNDILPMALEPLLNLRLQDSAKSFKKKGHGPGNPKKRRKELPHMSKKMRKINDYRKEVDLEMKEAEATIDKEEKKKFVSLN